MKESIEKRVSRIITIRIRQILNSDEDRLTRDKLIIKTLYEFIHRNIKNIRLNREDNAIYKALVSRNQRIWTEVENYYLKSGPCKTFQELCKNMPERSAGAIKLQLYRLGLVKKYKGIPEDVN